MFDRLGLIVSTLSFVVANALAAESGRDPYQPGTEREWCEPDQSCWPSQAKIDELKGKVSGTLLQVVDYGKVNDFSMESSKYKKDTEDLIMSQRYITKPGIIVEVASQNDVKECVLFATKYNIRLSVITSGHDFIGRNIAAGSLQINLYNLRSIKVDLNDIQHGPGGTAELDVGNNWGRVYKELDEKYKRVIVGGASPLVSMGGYTLGGGHSPMTRKLGLAVDNVIAIHLVTANGAVGVVTKDGWNFTESNGAINASNDADLFWALRGGGGGTFGIVTKVKFKIHLPPSNFQHMLCTWLFDTSARESEPGRKFFKFFGSFVKTLPREWGGYVLTSPAVPGTGIHFGYITVSMVHWGNYSHAEETSKDLRAWGPSWAYSKCNISSYNSFWEMWKNNNDATWSRVFIYSGTIQSTDWSDSLADDLVDSLVTAVDNKVLLVCTGTLVGGRATDFSDDSASVVSGLRRGDMALSCGTASPSPDQDQRVINVALEAAKKLYKHVSSGYINEPDARKSDWKKYYWGDNYDKLLTLKKKWDPSHVLTCRHCVGDNGGITMFAHASMTVVSIVLCLVHCVL